MHVLLKHALSLLLLALGSVCATDIRAANATVLGAGSGPGVSYSNLSLSQGSSPASIEQLYPLSSGKSASSNNISGIAEIVSASNSGSINSTIIAFISCENSSYAGLLGVDNVFDNAVAKAAAAIVLYAEWSEFCIFDTSSNTVQNVYTSRSRSYTAAILSLLRDSAGNRTYNATISPPSSTTSSAPSSTSSEAASTGPLGPSPTTAVAMIVLYAITGVITMLFLLIIVTGAIRAHRHPERYGPRTLAGRARQTRAGGLARAVLDSIPVVKFGERHQPKPTDVELAPTVDQTPADPVPAAETNGIAAATSTTITADAADTEHHQGCSICTEDFELGQDQRVLPCDHRFHPACIDPWLLNVSGTCPLCRIDLHPAESSEEPGAPLDAAAHTGDRRRRSVFIAVTGDRRPDGMTMTETVAALRRYRQARNDAPRQSAEPVQGAAESESRLRQRLSRVLNVRTWRTMRE